MLNSIRMEELNDVLTGRSSSYQHIIHKKWKTLNGLNKGEGKNINLCEKVFKIRVDFSDFQVSPDWGCANFSETRSERLRGLIEHALLFDSR